MAKRAHITPIFFLLLLSGLIAGCSGTPTASTTPSIATTALLGGTVNRAYSATVTVTGGAAPYTWSVSSGSLPSGLSLGSSTSNSVTITGTPIALGVFNFTVKVTDSVGVSVTSGTLTIRISNLAITTATPLPDGAVGVAYSVQFQASGGTAPYTWTLASGSTLPTGLTLSGTGLLSGTPTVAGITTFSITVADSESPAASATQSFSLTVTGPTGLALLHGNYAFQLRGFDSGGAVAVAGSFIADGAGHITSGVEDFNSIQGPPKNQNFTGTYMLGADDRGTLIFSSLSGSPTYVFAIDSTGAHARLVEFDATGVRGSGVIEHQTVTTCGASTISSTGATGESYAFGVTGSAAAFSGVTTAGPVVLAGAFTALPSTGTGVPGAITGEADVNIPGIAVPSPANSTSAPVVSGTFKATSQPEFCTMTLTPQQTSSGLTFDVYPVTGTASALTEAFVIETDTVASATPYLTSGEIIQQCILSGNACAISPFTGQAAGNFFTATSIGALTGQALDTQVTPNIYVPDVAIASLTGTSGPTFTMSVVENQAGTIQTYSSPFQGIFSTLDPLGRVSTDLALPFGPVFYIIGPNEALCIGQINNNPFFGYFLPQSTGPFNAATIKGTFIEGTLRPSTSTVENFSGIVTLDGVSTVTGTQDMSTPTSNTLGQAVTGTYTNINASLGSGIYALTAPSPFTGSFFIISATQFVMVSTTAGNNNPVLVVVGN